MDCRNILFYAVKSILRHGALEVIYNANMVTLRFGLCTGHGSEGAISPFWFLEVGYRSTFPTFLLFCTASFFVKSVILACDGYLTLTFPSDGSFAIRAALPGRRQLGQDQLLDF